MPTHKKQYKSVRKSRPRKSVRKSRRGGGGGVKTWAQNARNSYMVRLKYTLVPTGVQTDTRFVDTPYRFQSYQEARAYAKELFPCYTYVVEGSRDPPTFTDYRLEHDSKAITARLKDIDLLQKKLEDKKNMLLLQQKNIASNVF